jgi:hypothetical protein
MLPRNLIIILERYITIPVVVWLISQGLFGVEQKEALVEVINNILSAVILITMLFLSHNEQSHTSGHHKHFVNHFVELLKKIFTTPKKPQEPLAPPQQ